MAKFFGNGGEFAAKGDKASIPTGLQSNGNVSYETGYGSYYSASLLTDPNAKNVERQIFNQLLFDITEALGVLQNQGVWNWLSGIQYTRGMQVLHNNDSWMCLNTNTNSEPAEGNDNWLRMVELFQQIGTSSVYYVTDGSNITAPIKGSRVLVAGYWQTKQMPIQDWCTIYVTVNGQQVRLQKAGRKGGSKGHSFSSTFFFAFSHIYEFAYEKGDTVTVGVSGDSSDENLDTYYFTMTFLG